MSRTVPAGSIDRRAFEDPSLCDRLRRAIEVRARGHDGVLRFMEVCGTHTHAFFHHGIRGMLPANVRLLSGPGCPVCVTPTGTIDLALRLLEEPGVAIATYGDMIRVPGSASSLELERSRGGRVRIVYSPMDVLPLARKDPATTYVFLGVGFETTAPGTALLLEAAEREAIPNVRVLCAHKLVPPALAALLASEELAVDGLILPGHVSVILGSSAYAFLPERHGLGGAICGFDPADLLAGLLELTEMRVTGAPRIANLYSRYVHEEGNLAARALLDAFFVPEDADWRGLGRIPGSGLALAPSLARRDATGLLDRAEVRRVLTSAHEDPACRCGEVLCGTLAPPECGLFGQECTPETPVGPCMVSSEGTCAAYFRYGRTAGPQA